MKRWVTILLPILLLVLVLAVSGWSWVANLERKLLTTGPNGPRTPASLGLSYRHLRIASNDHVLDGYAVPAAPRCRPQVALLIFHGVGETISQWVPTQRLLYDHCVGSMTFDYSGEGDSTGTPSPQTFDSDAPAVYRAFTQNFASANRRCVLGFSMGDGIMLSEIVQFSPTPDCVVLGSAFTSGRASAHYGANVPWILLDLFPDPWNNVRNVANVHSPLLLVHSDADRANFLWMGEAVFRAAPEPKRLAVLHGLPHNAALHASTVWWQPVLEFLHS